MNYSPAGLRFAGSKARFSPTPHIQQIHFGRFLQAYTPGDLREIPAVLDYSNWLDQITVTATVSGSWQDSTWDYSATAQDLVWDFDRVGAFADLLETTPPDPEEEESLPFVDIITSRLAWDEFVPVLHFNDVQRATTEQFDRGLDWLRPAPFLLARNFYYPSGVPTREYDVRRIERNPDPGEDPIDEMVVRTLGFTSSWWPQFWKSSDHEQLGGFDRFWIDSDISGWTDAQWRDLRRTYTTATIDGGTSGPDIDLELTIS